MDNAATNVGGLDVIEGLMYYLYSRVEGLNLRDDQAHESFKKFRYHFMQAYTELKNVRGFELGAVGTKGDVMKDGLISNVQVSGQPVIKRGGGYYADDAE